MVLESDFFYPVSAVHNCKLQFISTGVDQRLAF